MAWHPFPQKREEDMSAFRRIFRRGKRLTGHMGGVMEKSSDVRRVREQREPLYVEVKEAILELARTQCGPDRRLPSEEELCRLLGVSRATVREALSILCREGFVSKRHGIGNLVNRSVLDTPMRFDLERGLRRMLEDAGYQASTIREMPVSP